MSICSDTSDLKTVSCVPLPEGDSFSGDTQLSPITSTTRRPTHATTTRSQKSIVDLNNSETKIKSIIHRRRDDGSIPSAERTPLRKVAFTMFCGHILI